MRRLLLLLLLACMYALGVTHASSAQAEPPSLQGEFLHANAGEQGPTALTFTDSNCSTTTNSTYSFHAQGVALGPYPGTFTESGTVTIAPGGTPTQEGPLGLVVDIQTTFTIDSVVGTVVGTKRFLANVPWRGICTDQFKFTSADVTYEARITTALGVFRDEGISHFDLQSLDPCGPPPFPGHGGGCAFSETFTLSRGLLPLDTTGKATGGGQIVSTPNPLERVTFGFNVRKTEDDRLDGRCIVLDHATGTHVKCLTVTDYQQIGNTATWEGMAQVNGVHQKYRITVQDNGEPNQGVDTFSIVTDTYQAGGNVTHGNVQIHKQALVDAP